MEGFRWLLSVGMLVTGCGGVANEDLAQIPVGERAADPVAQQPANANAAAQELPDANNQVAAIQRKIIFEAELRLVTSDFTKIEQDVPRLVERFEGYLADASIDRTSGSARSGKWIARIPVIHFDEFLRTVEALGVPENHRQIAQDVTEEYVDLQARIDNKRRLESRILALLEERTGELKHVIEVEQELARVREEIERMEGRLRYLADRVAMTTVTIYAREQRDYVPPQTPTFTNRIATVWRDSWSLLRTVSEELTIMLVAATPWLLILVPVGGMTYGIRRSLRKKTTAVP